MNGTGPHSGRVEICFNGHWGTICDDRWGKDDATVICNQLNFTDGGERHRERVFVSATFFTFPSVLLSSVAVGLSGSFFGPGSGPIFLDNADCSPDNHSNIIECFATEEVVGEHNCDHTEDASVICSSTFDHPVERET